MREILFRGKRIDTGEWEKGNLFIDDEKKKCEILVGYTNYRIAWEVDPTTIGQYTGLQNKNGKKIFEGDVVNKVDANELGWHRERKCRVSFDRFGYWMLVTEYGDGYWLGEFDSEQLEVIGNIHDNPELMEVES